jgi:GalNAc-alpha-(1->4)-GalNAc-alpha-(1->3)-diNAcBac-PP-undecaprenol alpha-1,4-N-acetyl-D-galactosaminyltransferase
MNNSRIKRICLIIPSLRHGGSERVMSLLANEWIKKENLSVNLILLTKQKKYYDLDKQINLIEPNITYKNNILSKLIYKFSTVIYIRRTCKQIQPDTILSFNEKYNNIVLLSLMGTTYDKYVSDRNNPFNSYGFVHDFLRRLLYKKATGIIAQTIDAKKELFRLTNNNNIKVIPNPLRNIKISNRKKENIILNIGRFVEQKNQLELIEIFNQCDHKGWILKIYGTGHLEKQLKDKINELKLNGSVEINDFTNDIDSVYQKAKIFVLTSIYEGFPNVLIEAMAHGLPSVSYDCQTGPKDIIINNVNGFLVGLNQKKKFHEQLNNLMNSEDLRKSISVESRKVKEKYSLGKISDKYLDFITSNEVNN